MKGAKMKRILFLLMAMLVVCVLATPAHAFLINRGTDTLDNRLIYDPDLNITWYDYTSSVAGWADQIAWASGLSVTFGSTTYDDWRLPSTVDGPVEGIGGFDGTTLHGYNITTSEMGHLFYIELGNKGYIATDGTYPQTGWGLTNTGDFLNLSSAIYWSGTEYAANTGAAWNFSFYNGEQGPVSKINFAYWGLAVRSGDVAAATSVPEPTTVALLGIGLAGMAFYGVRRRRRRG
jgi:hypothetical protein